MGLIGAAIGVLPSLRRPFVTVSGTAQYIAYWVLCVLAGTAVGVICAFVAARESEGMVGVLSEARTRFGLSVDASGHGEALRNEALRVLGDLTSVLSQAAPSTPTSSSSHPRCSQPPAAGLRRSRAGAAVTQTGATVEELAQTSKQIAENSQSVASRRAHARIRGRGHAKRRRHHGRIEDIRESNQVASDRILALGERSQEIGRVLVIIDEIAEQTKILALNAAIEAARAGEAGKGFAVVAEEIRQLADSVTESTSEIGRVVREIQSSTSSLVMSTERAQKKVDEGRDLALKTAISLEKIVSQVEETTDSAKQISIATQQQRTASDQVVVSMREMAQVSVQAAEASRQIQGAMAELNRLADALLTKSFSPLQAGRSISRVEAV